MVNLFRSATWLIIYSVKGAREITSALYVWCKTEVFLPLTQALVTLSRRLKSRNSWHRMHSGTAVMVERDKDWWTVQAYGPINPIVVVCSDYRMALKKLSAELDKQCNQYQLEQHSPEWWDAEAEDFSYESQAKGR
jgi:hypothetical protein